MITTMKKSTAEAGAGDDGLFWESKVAKCLGLSRDRVRALREAHLSPEDWVTKGNAVVLTARGLEKITALAQGEAAGEPVKAGPPEAARLVVRKVCGNPRVLLAVAVGVGAEGAAVLVRVKENTFFMPGMEFDALPVGDGSFQFVGRLPRRRGRW
jgi:hypothetical protein